MTALTPSLGSARSAFGAHTAPTVSALAAALREEDALLRDLIQVLVHQREAVARDDLQALDDSVFGTHRVLVTLGEARRRRIALNQRLGESSDLSLQALVDAFGGAPPAEIEAAIDALAETGERLHREVALNQRVLQIAVDAGDQLVRALCGGERGLFDRRA
jgi:hypothetical protein